MGLKATAPLHGHTGGQLCAGDYNLWSDVDIVLIAPRFRGIRILDRLRHIDTPPGYEVIAWTPEEFEKAVAKKNPLAIEALTRGIVLRDDLGIAKRPPTLNPD